MDRGDQGTDTVDEMQTRAMAVKSQILEMVMRVKTEVE